MKKILITLLALSMVVVALGGISAFASEGEGRVWSFKHPAFDKKEIVTKEIFAFARERAAEWREKIELTDEEKAEKLENFKDAWTEKMANGEIPEFDGEIDLSKFKPGNFAGKRFGGMKNKMPSLPENFTPDKDMFEGKDIEDIKEKLDGLTEEEKVQSSFGEKEFAGKPKIPGKIGRVRPGNYRPSFGTNEQ